MGKSISSNKREIEKRKQSKRLEKQKRKEERKVNGANSIDDMIAYVDENGQLRDTPPDPAKRQEINMDEIEVSIPKTKKENEDLMQKGYVEFFDSNKGFGFIKSEKKGEKYFFHISNAPEDIMEGDNVLFRLERGKRGMDAVEISLIK